MINRRLYEIIQKGRLRRELKNQRAEEIPKEYNSGVRFTGENSAPYRTDYQVEKQKDSQ